MPETVDPRHDGYRFEGLDSSDGTLFPNVLLDQVMAHLTGAEFKVLAYVVRRTLGLHRRSDTISLDHICDGVRRTDGTVLDAGTGLSKKTAIVALKGLQDKGIIVAGKSKGNLPTELAVRFRASDAEHQPIEPSSPDASSPG